MRFAWTKPIAAYFDAAAPAYAHSIDPVFSQLATSLVAEAAISKTDFVLDLGTGTGLVAKAASLVGAQVVGIDFSPAMLRIAKQQLVGTFVGSDIHLMPFASNSFDVALASFAFNSTDPLAAFSEVYRVLKPEGWLVLQEWAETDEISDLVSELFAEYQVDDPPTELAQLRAQMQEPIPWDDVESIEALAEMIAGVGFQSVEVRQVSPEILLPDADTFLRYKLAWPIRAAELAAMPDEIRTICLNDLRENIAPYIDRRTGQFLWQPNVVRISATTV